MPGPYATPVLEFIAIHTRCWFACVQWSASGFSILPGPMRLSWLVAKAGGECPRGSCCSDTHWKAMCSYAVRLMKPSCPACMQAPILYSCPLSMKALVCLKSRPCRVPVIVSENSAMAEVAGPAGLLVDPLSQQSLFDALVQISTDQDLYRSLESLTLGQCLRYDWGQSSERLYGHLNFRG
jgi:hypothetical protein